MPFATCASVLVPASAPRRLARLVSLGLLAGGLGACSDPSTQFAPACPALAFPQDGADLTRFAPAGHDVTDMVLDARLVAVPASCSAADPGKVKATLQVRGVFTRGPAATSRTADLTYFVAVAENDHILNEQDFPLHVDFPPNTDKVQLTDAPVELLLPVTPAKSASAYRIFVAFRLSPEELQYNRNRHAD